MMLGGRLEVISIEYRGAEYIVVQGVERSTWVRTVRLRDGEIKTGSTGSKPAASDDAEGTANKALASKSRRTFPVRKHLV
jgi:hypothetical protein